MIERTDASHYLSAYENKRMIIHSFHSLSHMVYVDLKKLELTQKKKYLGVFYASATFYDVIVRINEAKAAVQ